MERSYETIKAVGQAQCYAALGGIEAEIARETCEELVR